MANLTDAHIHFWRLTRGDNRALDPSMRPIYRDREPVDLEPLIKAAGISRIVVVQAAETLAENFYTVGLAARYSFIAGVVGWIDPGSPSIVEEVAAAALWSPLKGFRPVRNDNRSIAWMHDALLEPGWEAISTSNLSLDLLVQDWKEIPLATRFAARWPRIRMVLDHCGKPDIAAPIFDAWATSTSEFARLPNTFCKLSGLLNCAPANADLDQIRVYSDHVLHVFGPSRVLWASDWPPLDLASGYGAWRHVSESLTSQFLEADRDLIFGGTAALFYRLAEGPEQTMAVSN
jgi:L-fuconolactonase